MLFMSREVGGQLLLSDRGDEVAVAINVDDGSPQRSALGARGEGWQQGQLRAARAERVVLAGAGDAGGGRCEEVSPVKGGAHRREAGSGVRDGANIHDIGNGAGAGQGGAGGGTGDRGEEAVIGTDEVAGRGGVPGDGRTHRDREALAPDTGIDDGEHDRGGGEGGQGGLKQPGALVDGVGGDLVGEVDEGGAGRTGAENGLHLAHVGVVRSEVSQQKDRQGSAHPIRHSCTLRKRSAGQKITPMGGDSTEVARR